MKFTDKDLAKAMGLKVGDRIAVKGRNDQTYNYELNLDYNLNDNSGDYYAPLEYLIDREYEILPRKKTKKKIGELICKDINCRDCPLCIIHCANMSNESLYDNFEYTFEDENDSELYDIFKARLDKEVEE